MKNLAPAERLIVAADFEPDGTGITGIKKKVIDLALALSGLGCLLKLEAVLRACGYDLIDTVHDYGLGVFVDLKLSGIPQTLKHDGMLLRSYQPELVTAMCPTGKVSLVALREELPDTEVIGVSFLTHMDKEDASRLFGEKSEDDAVLKLASEADSARFDGIVSAPAELSMLRSRFGGKLSLITPNVRPSAVEVAGDDQNRKRSMTPAQAIRAEASRLVIGRPITQAENPREAAQRIIEEIAAAA